MIHDFDPAVAARPLGHVGWYGAVHSLGLLGALLLFWGRRPTGG